GAVDEHGDRHKYCGFPKSPSALDHHFLYTNKLIVD
ncbi:MAG: hypothetical protein RLZ80_763, partial [Actinomycetota bacterium]